MDMKEWICLILVLQFTGTAGEGWLLLDNAELDSLAPQSIWEEPHNCSGNVEQCSAGFTLKLTFQQDTAGYPDIPQHYIIASGGQNSRGNGYYVRQVRDKFYEIGVARGSSLWRVDLSLSWGSPCHLALSWSNQNGLKVYVDGFLAGEASQSNQKVYVASSVAPYRRITIGKSNDVESSDYPNVQVGGVSMVDSVLNDAHAATLAESLTDSLKIGCSPNSQLDGAKPTQDANGGTSATACRSACYGDGEEIAFYADGSCSCMSFQAFLNGQFQPTPCTDATGVYVVQHTIKDRSFLDEIGLEVTIGRPSARAYIRPNEVISFTLKTSLPQTTDVTFRFQFGDSVEIRTKDMYIGHSYATAGQYTVIIRAETLTSTQEITEILTIEEVDETVIPHPEYIWVYPNYDQKPRTVTAALSGFSTKPATCSFLSNNGKDPASFSNYVENHNFVASYITQYVYELIGIYEVQMVCTNQAGETSSTYKAISVNPLSQYEYVTLAENTEIEVDVHGAQDDSLEVDLGGVRLKKEESYRIQSGQLVIKREALTIGEHALQISSNSRKLFEKTYNVQRAIEGVSISASTLHAMANQNITFEFIVRKGSNVHTVIDFGDGHSEQLYLHNVEQPHTILRTHQYKKLADYDVTFTLVNDISEGYDILSIQTQREIETAEMHIANQTTLGQPTKFTFLIDKHLPSSSRVSIEFFYDDGKDSSVVVLGTNGGQNIPLKHQHTYEQYGIYRVRARVFNDISSQWVYGLHQVGENLTMVDIEVMHDHVELGQEVELHFDVPRGAAIYLVVDMGDGLGGIIYNDPDTYTRKDCRKYPEVYANWYDDSEFGDDDDADEEEEDDESSGKVEQLSSRKRRYIIERMSSSSRKRRSLFEDMDDIFSGSSGDYDIDFSGELDESMFARTTPLPTAPSPTSIPNDVITLRYIYEQSGKFHVSANVSNCFNNVATELCPEITIVEPEGPSVACEVIELSLDGQGEDDMKSHFRSDEIVLSGASDIQCTASDGYSVQEYVTWRPEWKTVHNQWRPSPDFCGTEVKGTQVRIPGRTFSYGVHRMTATLWLRLAKTEHQGQRQIPNESGDSGEEGSGGEGVQISKTDSYAEMYNTVPTLIRSASVVTYFRVVPSPLLAEIRGSEELQVYNNSVAVSIDISKSTDPDVAKPNNRTGFISYVFCFKSSIQEEMQSLTLSELVARSKPKTRNLDKSVYVFDLDSKENGCFLPNTTVKVYDHDIRVTRIKENEDLTFHLVVTKDVRQASTMAAIRVMSVDLSDSDALLDILTEEQMKKDPGAGIMVCGVVADNIKNAEPGGGEVQNTVSKLMGKTEFLGVYAQNYDQVMDVTGVVGGVSENKDNMVPSGQEKAAGSLDNAAGTATALGDTADEAKVEDLFNNLGTGASQVIPFKEDNTVHPIEVKRRKRRSIELGEEPVEELTCCEKLYGMCKWIEPKSKAVREIYRKSLEWDELECNIQPPDDVKEIQKRYDAMLDAEAAAAKALDLRTADKGMGSVGKMGSLLGGKQSEGKVTTIPSMNLQVQKMDSTTIKTSKRRRRRRKRRAAKMGMDYTCNDFGDEDIADEACQHGVLFGNMCLPDSMVETMSPENSIMNMDTKNPFDGDNMNSKVATMEISMSGKSQKVAEESCPIVIEIKGKPENFKTEVGTVFVDSKAKSQDWYYKDIPITVNGSVLYITLKPENLEDSYEVALSYEDLANDTRSDFFTEFAGHGFTELVRQKRAATNGTEGRNTTKLDPTLAPTYAPDSVSFDIFETPDEYYAYTIRVPANITELAGNYTVGIRAKTARLFLGEETKRNITYNFGSYAHKCQYWNKAEQAWASDGCKVAANSNPLRTLCLCDHLTSFGGDMVVPPNTINFATVFSLDNFMEALPVFFTVVFSLILYIVVLIWARKEDKKDLIKWGAAPLEDNLPTDTYHYQVSVYTKVKKKAGTKSKISFILSGDESDTGVRRLYDGKRKEFPSGSIYNFVLSVEDCLGPLTYLRIWHDNSGKGKNKGWYLDQVQLTDLQTGQKSYFLLDKWLAVEEGDGQVERIIPVATSHDLSAFKHLFNSSFRKKLTNDHMWVSIVSRPTRSSFTRVQRVSCCVSLLFLTMITNCMFFKTDERDVEVQALHIGPITFTLHQVFISVVTTAIVLPPSVIIVTIFRKARPKTNTVQQDNQRLSSRKFHWRSVNGGSVPWNNVKRSRMSKMKESVRNIINSHLGKKYETKDPEVEKMKKIMKKKKAGTFPYWTNYIAWTLVWLSIIASGFFTILYSMEWGREKALDWLTTFFLSFFQNVIVVQPAKVLILAAFVSIIMKKPETDEEEDLFDDGNVPTNSKNDPLTMSQIDLQEMIKKRQMAASEIGPPDTKSLEAARQLRMKEMAMETILKECVVYVFFILVLFFLSYETRDSNSFILAQNIKNTFVDTSPSFTGITKPESFWAWTQGVLIPNLYSSNWYNGKPLSWDEALQIDDRYTIRVGVARLRQLRIQDNSCKVEQVFRPIIKHCRSSYDWVDDDVEDYLPGWERPTGNRTIDAEEMETSSWVYRNSFELKSAPYLGLVSNYKGGGYTFSFLRNPKKTVIMLKELEEFGWVDPNTRGLFVEFTLYNANVNLFASVILLLEFLDTGGAISKTEVKVFRLSSYVGTFGIIVILFEVMYACFTIYFFTHMVRQIKKKKWGYFKDTWDLLEFATLIMCVIVIIMYAMKKVFGAAAMSVLEETGSGEYVNFVTISVWDEIFGFVLAIVVFLTTVKFIKMLKFNRRMGMMGETIAYCIKDLKIFSVTFMLYYMAFCMMAYKLFGSSLSDYSSFIATIESLFAFALGSFSFDDLRMANPFGPIFFFMYVAVVQIGLMSMFLTIICDAFAAVKEDTHARSNDYEIVEFIWGRAKNLLGIGGRSSEESGEGGGGENGSGGDEK